MGNTPQKHQHRMSNSVSVPELAVCTCCVLIRQQIRSLDIDGEKSNKCSLSNAQQAKPSVNATVQSHAAAAAKKELSWYSVYSSSSASFLLPKRPCLEINVKHQGVSTSSY